MLEQKGHFEKQGFQVCPLSILSYETEGSGVFNFSNALSSVSLMNEYVGIIGYVWKGWLKNLACITNKSLANFLDCIFKTKMLVPNLHEKEFSIVVK